MNIAYNVYTENEQVNMSSRSRDKEEMLDKMATGKLSRAFHMTGDQHEHILEMLNQDLKQYDAMANMAGMTGKNHSPKIKIEDPKWIVDNGSTNHMTSNFSIISDIKLLDRNMVEEFICQMKESL